MAHKLGLQIDDSHVDTRHLYLFDISSYDAMLPVKYRLTQVRPPFTDKYIELELPQNGYKAFTTKDLHLSGDECDIPDGYYHFHYSTAPNDKVFITRGHYQVALLMSLVLSKMVTVSVECDTYIDVCGNISVTKQENMLLHIWMLLQGVQALGKNEMTAHKADELYIQAQRCYQRLYQNDTCKEC
jgi:hypothetical protein